MAACYQLPASSLNPSGIACPEQWLVRGSSSALVLARRSSPTSLRHLDRLPELDAGTPFVRAHPTRPSLTPTPLSRAALFAWRVPGDNSAAVSTDYAGGVST